jgi:hypothetical protein
MARSGCSLAMMPSALCLGGRQGVVAIAAMYMSIWFAAGMVKDASAFQSGTHMLP